MATCYSFSSDSLLSGAGGGVANSSMGACGSGSYQTCCKIGDTCYQSGFCLSSTDKANIPWYLGGCTSQQGSSYTACPGFCPNGYPAMVYDTYEEEWQCCPSYPANTDNLIGCVSPKYVSGTTRYFYSAPEQLQATAIVKNAGSYSPLSYSTSAYYYPYSTRSYSSYTYTYGDTYPTYTRSSSRTAAGYYPTNTDDSGNTFSSANTCTDNDCGNAGPSPIILVVIIIPTIVGVVLIGILIWLMVRAHKKHVKKYPFPTGVPVGEQVHQHVMAAYTPAQSKDMYDRKMAAMSWISQQPPQRPQPPQPGQQGQGSQPIPQAGAAEGVTPPFPTRNPPDVPNQQTRGMGGAPAPFLPPIQEVSQIEPTDVVAGGNVSTGEGVERSVSEANGQPSHDTQPADTAAASSTPSDSNWPLGGSAPAATKSEGPALPDTANEPERDPGAGSTQEPSSSVDPKEHHDDLYA